MHALPTCTGSTLHPKDFSAADKSFRLWSYSVLVSSELAVGIIYMQEDWHLDSPAALLSYSSAGLFGKQPNVQNMQNWTEGIRIYYFPCLFIEGQSYRNCYDSASKLSSLLNTVVGLKNENGTRCPKKYDPWATIKPAKKKCSTNLLEMAADVPKLQIIHWLNSNQGVASSNLTCIRNLTVILDGYFISLDADSVRIAP